MVRSQKKRFPHSPACLLLVAAAVAIPPLAGGSLALAQTPSPVYVDDSPAAAEGLSRATSQIRSGDFEKGVRLIQRIMDEEGKRLITRGEDPNLFISVRERIHRLLLADREALESYRAINGAAAERLLEAGRIEEVEERLLLTSAGFEAALQLAQRQMERAAFATARRTLEQLEDHPDRQGEWGRDAAALLTAANRYLDNESVAKRARRWRAEADVHDEAPPRIEGPDIERGHSVWRNGPALALDDVLSQPFWSTPLTLADESAPERQNESESEARANTRLLHVVPTVAGDAIYINDGQAISAWDRFTMSLRWRVDASPIPSGLRGRSVGRLMLEDFNSVTVSDPWAVAATGLARQGAREGDKRVHAINARTGERAWAVDIASLDPALADSHVRGPLLIEEGRVVARADKQVKQRRLMSIHLAGLDLATGDLAWQTALGSRGTLPYATTGRVAEPILARDGIVYVVSKLGFAAAVEAGTGRVQWLRRFVFDSTVQIAERAWQSQSSALIDGTLFAITPGQTRIVGIDAAGGEIRADRSANLFGRPRYLLAAAGHLIAIGERTAFALDASKFDDSEAAPRQILNARADGFWGRVVVAGERVLAPTNEGLLAADVDAPDGAPPDFVELEMPGNPVASEGQLVVVDDNQVHSYLIWSVAEEILARRMEMDPSDPRPAMTYAELAHRAGRYDQILPALDAALSSIERDPLDPRNQEVRARLFESVARMTDPDPKDRFGIDLEDSLLRDILTRQERLAATPDERVAHLLAKGDYYEQTGEPARAVDAYQRILIEDPLAAARLDRHGVTLQAEIEATKRVRRLLGMFGRDLYASYEAEAARELDAVSGTLDPEVFTRIARRYPVARAGVRAWLEASAAYRTRGQPHGAIRALEEGLIAARDALPQDDELIGELAGRLVRTLIRQGRYSAAGATIARVRDRWPNMTFTDEGSPIDIASLGASISERLALLHKRPEIGLLPSSPGAQTLRGWTLTEPLIEKSAAAGSEFVVLASEDELGLFGRDSVSGLRKIWTIPADESMSVLAMTQDSVLIAVREEKGVSVHRYDLPTGKRDWETPPFNAIFANAPHRREGGREGGEVRTLETRTQGERPITEVLTALDDQTIVLIERSGRGAAIDLETGRVLWTREGLAPAIHDIATRSGQLLIGGADARKRDPETGRAPAPHIALHDLRSGKHLQSLDAEKGMVRWVRLAESGAALVGMDRAIASYDLFQGHLRWNITSDAGRRTVDAWLFPGRLIVLNDQHQLQQFDLEDGSSAVGSLETRDRVTADSGMISAADLDGSAAFATRAGIVIFDEAGNLAGADQRRGYASLVPAAFAEEHIVAIDSVDASRLDEETSYEMLIFSATSVRLLQTRPMTLGARPHTIGLLDGRILISAGDTTVVLDASAE